MQVLIVDDHPIVISGCRALLADETGVEVLEAADAESGHAAYKAARPDVAVIDINLPGASGFDLLRRILGDDPAARVLMFSMNDDPMFASRAIEFGARGFITKNDDPALFIEAIRRIATGDVFLTDEMARRLAFSAVAMNSNPLRKLSLREIEILRLLARGRTMAEIGATLKISYKTVANNCTLIKHKLGARTPVEMVRVAVENGLS